MPNVCYKPDSFEELYQLLLDDNVQPKPQLACLAYGYYYSKFGIKTKYFQSKGLNNSTFKGRKIKTWYPSTLIYLIKYLKYFKEWNKAHRAVFNQRINISNIFRYKI